MSPALLQPGLAAWWLLSHSADPEPACSRAAVRWCCFGFGAPVSVPRCASSWLLWLTSASEPPSGVRPAGAVTAGSPADHAGQGCGGPGGSEEVAGAVSMHALLEREVQSIVAAHQGSSGCSVRPFGAAASIRLGRLISTPCKMAQIDLRPVRSKRFF